MPVHQQDVLTGLLHPEHDRLNRLQAVEERFRLPGGHILRIPQVLANELGVGQREVVVAPHPDESSGAVEREQLFPHRAVGPDDVLEVVLPELVAVAGFDIGETAAPVVVERGGVRVLVLEELVGLRAVAAVAVTHDDVARAVVDQFDAGPFVGLRETRRRLHSTRPPFTGLLRS